MPLDRNIYGDCLYEAVIDELVMQFMAYLTDDSRRAVLDKLGTHPVNHARFMERLVKLDAHHERVLYYDLTKWMG